MEDNLNWFNFLLWYQDALLQNDWLHAEHVTAGRCSGKRSGEFLRSSHRSRSSRGPRGRRRGGTPFRWKVGRLNTISLGGSHLLTALLPSWQGSPRGRSCRAARPPSRTTRPWCSCAARTRCRGCARRADPKHRTHRDVSLQIADSCGFIIQKTPNIHLWLLPARTRHILLRQWPPVV